jgi:phosphomannomutase
VTDQILGAATSLRESLTYEPRELRFGTSGRRGEVEHLTQLELYSNVLGELRYLQGLAAEEGGITTGDAFYFAFDLRPSSTSFEPLYGGRGELAQTIVRAISDAGMRPVNLGCVPTPALSYLALEQGKGSIMVTGSHIPFDRNGYKLNTSIGELTKEQEAPISQAVNRERQRLYNQNTAESPFNSEGMFKTGHSDLPPATDAARNAYAERYLEFFRGQSLNGTKLLVYQHSAVARDLLVELLTRLGAEVIAVGRSTEFVPIDTENIDDAQLATIQQLADAAVARHGQLDAIVSTDGDSDRPLLLGFEDGQVRFFGGDLVGMAVAEYLKADAVVVPISCNDSIDRTKLAQKLRPKTRIGSPFVIAGMQAAIREGAKVVCGWEANGGFLLGSEINRNGRLLRALPTRDAVLPILCTIFSACEQQLTLPRLFDRLSVRFSKAGLIKNFPRSVSVRMLEQFSPPDSQGREFEVAQSSEHVRRICDRLALFFSREKGFGSIVRLNYIDGVRIIFDNGEVAHMRPSGNADELRMYAVADSRERAEQIVAAALAEPHGILRQIEHSCEG